MHDQQHEGGGRSSTLPQEGLMQKIPAESRRFGRKSGESVRYGVSWRASPARRAVGYGTISSFESRRGKKRAALSRSVADAIDSERLRKAS